MADDTVFANGQSVATLGTDHVAVNREEKDEILIPPRREKKRTLNIAHMPALKEGSARTFYAGQPVWTMAGFLSESEEYPASPAGSVGAKTQTPYRGSAFCLKGSPDVFVESNAVVRYLDPTKQDSGNSLGVVLKRADLDALKKALDAETQKQDGDGDTDKKKGRRWGDVMPTNEEIDVEPPPEPVEAPPVVPVDARCTLGEVTLTCQHGRKVISPKTKYLEVVPDGLGEDTITVEMAVTNNCGDAFHPNLVVKNAADLSFSGSPQTFGAKNRIPTSSEAGGLLALVKLAQIVRLIRVQPKQYDLTVTTCSGPRQITVYSYPGGGISAGAEFDWLAKYIDPLMEFIGFIVGAEIKLTIAAGSISLSAEWQEQNNHRAACEVELDLGFSPLIGAQVDVPIRLPAALGWVQRALEKVLKWFAGSELKFFFTFKGSLDVVTTLKARFWRTTKPTFTGAGRKIKGSFRAGVGMKCELFGDVVKFRSDLTAGTSIQTEFLGKPEGFDVELEMVFGDIKGLVEFEIDLGKIPLVGGGIRAAGRALSAVGSYITGKQKDLDISETNYSKEVTVWDGVKWEPDPVRLFPRS
jgi:hypothetical protein